MRPTHASPRRSRPVPALPTRAAEAPELRPRLLAEQCELVDVRTLHEHPENANQADDGALYEAIGVNGFYGALAAQRSTRRVLVGHGRRRAAMLHGLYELPVFWLDVDDAEALRILGGDNWLRDRADSDRLAELALLDKIARTSGSLAGTGKDQDDLDQLTRELGDAHLAAAGVDGDVSDMQGTQADAEAEGEGGKTGERDPDPEAEAAAIPAPVRKVALALAKQLAALDPALAGDGLVAVFSPAEGPSGALHRHECRGALRRFGLQLVGATASGPTTVELYGRTDAPAGAEGDE